ncbi:PTS sugar transporter subunit IIA, partial [Bifidobacterium longum]
MLEHQYRKQFGMYIDSIETCDVARVGTFDFSHIDYVFTTVPLNVKLPVPVREADFFLETSDVNAIRKVLSDDTAQSDSVSSFFSRALFFNRVEASSKQAVLRYLSERAVESGRVDAQFAQEVAERESASATSFGNGVAMPHGMHPLSAEAFVTVGLLEHPILWDEYGHEVDIVFMVSFARSGGDEA